MPFLKRKHGKVLLFLTSLYSSIVFSAQTNSDLSKMKGFSITYPRTVISFLGGYSNMNPEHSLHSYTGTDDDVFVYQNSNQHENTGIAGSFVGLEWMIHPKFLVDAGLEYDYFWSIDVNGSNSVGIEPATSTPYHYEYHLQSQQVIAVVKLLYTMGEIFHPYSSLGLGSAFNRSNHYTATTSQTGSINLTPTFESNTETTFSYNVSVGIDIDIASNVRLGLAYRFSDLGHFSLGDGAVTYNYYQASVPFSLSGSHWYANQFLVDLNFLI